MAADYGKMLGQLIWDTGKRALGMEGITDANGAVLGTYNFPKEGGPFPITGADGKGLRWGIGSIWKDTPECACCRAHTDASLDVRVEQVGGSAGEQLETWAGAMKIGQGVLPPDVGGWGWGSSNYRGKVPINLRVKVELGDDICFDRTFTPAFGVDRKGLPQGTTTGTTPPPPKSIPTPNTVPPNAVPIGRPVEVNGKRGRWYRLPGQSHQDPPVFIPE
jgi:hypothetical protein